MTTAQTTRREDYYRFHQIQVRSGDMDPVYPVLHGLAEDLNLVSFEQRAWLVFCHVTYYHLGSALRAFTETSNPRHALGAALDLPVATERRGHWSRPRLRAHLADLQARAREPGGLTGWLSGGLYGTPEENWATVQHRVASVKGNGRWAAFKTTEMLQQVCGMDLRAPDMQHAHSSGPRKGLGLLYANLPEGNGPAEIITLDAFSSALVNDMRLRGLTVSVETAETSLCDFHSMVRGRYYPGHDIDQMQLQLDAVPSQLTSRAYRARIGALPHAYLGELHGRRGIDRELMIRYRTTGEVPER